MAKGVYVFPKNKFNDSQVKEYTEDDCEWFTNKEDVKFISIRDLERFGIETRHDRFIDVILIGGICFNNVIKCGYLLKFFL